MAAKQFECRWRGHRVQVHAWTPESPVGVVQIVHGMAEHGARYARLAQALNGAGFAVYAQDLPGHGGSITEDSPRGHFADHSGWAFALESIESVQERVRRDCGGLPLFMIGHSMGSFLLQHYVLEYGQRLAGAVFSASTGNLGPLRAVGLNLLRAEALWHGRRQPSAVGDLLSFKSFNRAFKPARTDFDWLSRDSAEVDRYVADPLCGFRCTTALWMDLMQACARLDDPRRLRRLDHRLPVLLICGEADPVSRGARGPEILAAAYRKAGLGDVRLRSYPGARHELFNETCRDEVTAELVDWLRNHLPVGRSYC